MRPLIGWLGVLVLAGLPGLAGAQPGEANVRIVSEPWSAPFSAPDLATALRLRLGDGAVEVASDETPDAPELRVRSSAGPQPSLRVERGGEALTDIPLSADRPEDACRRAAVVIALLAAPGSPPSTPPAASIVATAPAPAPGASPPPSPPVPDASGSRPVASSTGPAGPSPATARATVGGGLGAAVAAEAGMAATALTLNGRWFVAGGAGLQIGAKLAGGFEQTAPGLRATVSDRALWAGACYRTWWSTLGLDLGLALQYTLPVVDVDGEDGASVSDASITSRLGLRASAQGLWAIQRHLALALSVGATASFEEREFQRDGHDFMELGTTTLDVLGGAEVMW